MANFVFPCPQCAQHIQYDDAYVGYQINCPTCQAAIIVPAASAPAPAGKSGGGGLRVALISLAVAVVCAGLGFGGWHFYSQHKAKLSTSGNPAAQVAAPTSAATIQALSILSKVHSAYTNMTSVKADATVALFLDLSNITVADISPDQPANAKNTDRHPPGMPKIFTNLTEISIKQAQSNLYCFNGEAVSKIDRMTMSNTFAFWSSDKGKFMFTDSHLKGIPATYMQLPDVNPANDPSAQFKQMQHLFDDPAQLTKIIKDLGQTDDESVRGQDCYTLTAKVLGQKVKLWVDKTSYLISQWQITLGGKISDADIDDAFALVGAGMTNLPPAQLELIKVQVKKRTPMMTKIRGTITSTSRHVELNPAFSADDFIYPVPPGVRLVRLPGAAATQPPTALAARQRNTCINNLRQLDAAKNQFALEQGKKAGDPVTEADIKPYIKLNAAGNLPQCPGGGKYTLGKVGEKPACSVAGHVLP